MTRSRIRRFTPRTFFENAGQPATDIFDAAVLRAPPDLGKIIADGIISFMLHGITSCFGENATEAAYRTRKLNNDEAGEIPGR